MSLFQDIVGERTYERIIWLDALRAFLAFGIVLCHTHIVFGDDAFLIGEHISTYFIGFRVPCFYFLSGFLSIKALERYSGAYVRSRVVILFRRLLVPGVLFLFLAVPFSLFISLMSNGCLMGNYFLLALFEIAIFNDILIALGRGRGRMTVIGLLIVGAMVTTTVVAAFHDRCFDYLHWKQSAYGNLYYVAGLICGFYLGGVFTFMSRRYVLVAALMVIVGSHFLLSLSDVPYVAHKVMVKYLLPASYIIGLFSVFKNLDVFFSRFSAMGSIAHYLGQRTLATYVISWVFIYALSPLSTFAGIIDSDILFWMCFVVVYFASLFVHDLICLSPRLERYVFGRDIPLKGFSEILRNNKSQYCRKI